MSQFRKLITSTPPSIIRYVVQCCTLVLLSGCVATGQPQTQSAPRSDLPIADLHLHPDPGLSTEEVKDRMDKNGIKWGGGGVIRGDKTVWQHHAKDLGNRFIAFAGQSEMNGIFRSRGIKAMEDENDPGVKALLIDAEADLMAGRVKGLGTVFANNSRAHPNPRFRRKAQTDSSSIRRLYDLAGKYGVALSIQMHADEDSLLQLARLIATNPNVALLWTQCGSDTTFEEVRRVLEQHGNVYCELSWRFPPVTPARLASRNIFDKNGPNGDWLAVMEAFPDRFMIGIDAHIRSRYDESVEVVRSKLLPYLKPQTARLIAFENAQRVFKLN
jgi:hypothetical protein